MYTQKKPIENTHIVRERDRQRSRELLAVLALGAPIGFFLLLFAWQNVQVIQLGRETTRLQNQLKETETRHKALQSELDRLTSLETVEAKAKTLSFAPADPKAIVTVSAAADALGRRPVAAAPMSQAVAGRARVAEVPVAGAVTPQGLR